MESNKNIETGKWDRKYNVMVFKANHGHQFDMNNIVQKYVKSIKSKDPEILVLEETDDFRVKTWVVGNSKNINKMVDEEFNRPR